MGTNILATNYQKAKESGESEIYIICTSGRFYDFWLSYNCFHHNVFSRLEISLLLHIVVFHANKYVLFYYGLCSK